MALRKRFFLTPVLCLVGMTYACGSLDSHKQKGSSKGASDSSAMTSLQNLDGKLFAGNDLLGRSCTVDFRSFGDEGRVFLTTEGESTTEMAIPGRISDTDCHIERSIMRHHLTLLTGADRRDGGFREVNSMEIQFNDHDLTQPFAVVAATSMGRTDRLACTKLRAKISLHMADFRCRKLSLVE